VSQQATFDIELGEYERCLVARFHPLLIRSFLEKAGRNGNHPQLKSAFQEVEVDRNGDGVINPRAGDVASDIDKQGIMICSGRPQRGRPLPVKEKYYYMTQHFTEGDMLDTADLHNHPWLLQLRGFRDFQAFTATIGAREVFYDSNDWASLVFNQTLTDMTSFNLQGSQVDNLRPEFEVVNQESDINWPLNELSRTYFEVLPTFPGLYTYMNESGEHVEEWPYANTDPGRSFENND
jgi:hypothetical protein